MKGWIGNVLEINLSTGEVATHGLDPDMARLYIGGRGIGMRLLWDLVGPEVDPLSAENVLIFATGPLTGTGFQTSNRFSVSTKSPQTGTALDANSGGRGVIEIYSMPGYQQAADNPAQLEGLISLWCRASATASARLETPSLDKMLLT